MAGEQLLSVEALERDLQNAERELGKAVEARQRASSVEDQWKMEVTSLTNLIQVRKQRMVPQDWSVPSAGDSGTPFPNGGLPQDSDEEFNRVDWIDGLIAASGVNGISPPEILRRAEQAHISMHPNYPYVVLKKLVAKERAVKRRGRYYNKDL